MTYGDQEGKLVFADWAELAIQADRFLKGFLDLLKPVLVEEGYGDLTLANVLLMLSLRGGRRRISDIVQRGRTFSSTLSYSIKNLCEKDLLLKSVDEADRRAYFIALTDEGARLVACLEHSLPEIATGAEAAVVLQAITNFEAACGS